MATLEPLHERAAESFPRLVPFAPKSPQATLSGAGRSGMRSENALGIPVAAAGARTAFRGGADSAHQAGSRYRHRRADADRYRAAGRRFRVPRARPPGCRADRRRSPGCRAATSSTAQASPAQLAPTIATRPRQLTCSAPRTQVLTASHSLRSGVSESAASGPCSRRGGFRRAGRGRWRP